VKVLVIDDDEDIRKLARLSLETVGRCEVRMAASGREGIALAQASPPDLIVVDRHMPGLDGVAVLGELRETPSLRGVPVVIMTARPQPADVERYLELGAIGVVAKPFDPMKLADQLRRLLHDARG
jgi:CheY-like chemotaxis protein